MEHLCSYLGVASSACLTTQLERYNSASTVHQYGIASWVIGILVCIIMNSLLKYLEIDQNPDPVFRNLITSHLPKEIKHSSHPNMAQECVVMHKLFLHCWSDIMDTCKSWFISANFTTQYTPLWSLELPFSHACCTRDTAKSTKLML